MKKIIMSLNPKKVTGLFRIPLKITETAANAKEPRLVYIMIKDPKENPFSENSKRASVRPLYQINDRDETKYNSVSFSNSTFQIYERYFHNSLSVFTVKMFYKFVLDYRKINSLNHVLLKLFKN